RLNGLPAGTPSGRVVRASGLVLEAAGLKAPLGGACRVELAPHEGRERCAEAEVVGFTRDKLYLMPLAEVPGLVAGARVTLLGEGGDRRFPVGEGLLGRVLDGNGRPLDALGPLADVPYAPLATEPLNPLARAPIE